MSHPNVQLIRRFYAALQRRDAEAMSACYAPRAVFSDPAFGELHGDEIGWMWRMLLARAHDFSVAFDGVDAADDAGGAQWTATYVFSQSGRMVVNQVRARFVFVDGLIAEHRDSFNLWRWAAQAFGLKGSLLGWTPFMQHAIRTQARRSLDAYRSGVRAYADPADGAYQAGL